METNKMCSWTQSRQPLLDEIPKQTPTNNNDPTTELSNEEYISDDVDRIYSNLRFNLQLELLPHRDRNVLWENEINSIYKLMINNNKLIFPMMQIIKKPERVFGQQRDFIKKKTDIDKRH